jgi:D-lactate dehydrogenase
MRVTVFSTKPYDRTFLLDANAERHDLHFLEPRLTPQTARLAEGSQGICAFVNDEVSAEVLEILSAVGIRFVALRSAGFNHVDLQAARRLGIRVARVPAYSPAAVAEHACGLVLTLNRQLHRAYNRVREGNFALDGLLGFDLAKRIVGVIGTGQIGQGFARIMAGFGCSLLGHDPHPDPTVERLGVRYVGMDELLRNSDIISLHCPLTSETRHLIDRRALSLMKPGAMLINTGRGALVDTRAVIDALKRGTLGYLGIDVYEEEEELFFEDRSREAIQDDVFARLLTFPNVLVTAHQGFFTRDALGEIARTTIGNLDAFEIGAGMLHEVVPPE